MRDLSIELMRTKRAFGIVKRVRTIAFDGLILYETGREEECLDENDREVLAWIMPEGSLFAYRWLFGSPGRYQYYSNLRGVYHMYVKSHGAPRDMGVVMDECVNVTRKRIKNNLDCDPEVVFEAARYYARSRVEVPPFCVEAHRDADLGKVLPYLLEFNDPATGLPFPIDLVDQEVSLGRGRVADWLGFVLGLRANAPLGRQDDRIPEVLDLLELGREVLDRDIERLSGGERQRLALAVALLLRREVFLLDEPTSALDDRLKRRAVELFCGHSDWTVLAVSHDAAWLEHPAARIYDLEVRRWRR